MRVARATFWEWFRGRTPAQIAKQQRVLAHPARTALLAGGQFGVFMGVISGLSNGIVAGVVGGVACGLLFGPALVIVMRRTSAKRG